MYQLHIPLLHPTLQLSPAPHIVGRAMASLSRSVLGYNYAALPIKFVSYTPQAICGSVAFCQ